MDLEIISKKEDWGSILAKYPNTSFLQSWEWANFQQYGLGKKVYRTAEYGLCIVETTRFGDILYLPRGPLADWSNDELDLKLHELVTITRDMGFVALRIDPAVDKSSNEADKINKIGFKKSNSIMQVENAWIIDLFLNEKVQDLFDIARSQGMHKKLPSEIRRSAKKGLHIKILTGYEDIEILLDLLNELSKRKGFVTRDDNYFRKQWKYMSPTGKEKLFVGFYEDKPIAAALIAFDKREGSYLHAASVEGYSNLYAPAAVLWSAVEYSKRIGCERFNFWGVIDNMEDQNNPGYGYSRFKMRFGGRVEKYVGTMDYIIKPLKYGLIKIQDKYRSVLYTHR